MVLETGNRTRYSENGVSEGVSPKEVSGDGLLDRRFWVSDELGSQGPASVFFP